MKYKLNIPYYFTVLCIFTQHFVTLALIVNHPLTANEFAKSVETKPKIAFANGTNSPPRAHLRVTSAWGMGDDRVSDAGARD